MNVIWSVERDCDAVDDMARIPKRPVDAALVTEHLGRLKAARTDEACFNAAVSGLKQDGRVQSVDLVAIAKQYAGTARKITSKTTALDAIQKRFVELVRFEARNELAAKSRPW